MDGWIDPQQPNQYNNMIMIFIPISSHLVFPSIRKRNQEISSQFRLFFRGNNDDDNNNRDII